jgi:hypothetical protein
VTRTPTDPSRVLQPAGQASAAWFQNRQAAGIEAADASPQPQSPWPAAPRPEGAWPAAPDGWASGQQAAQTVANPVRGDRTVAGMPVRVPHANLVPGSADGQRGASQPVASQGAASSGLPQRSAETARSRLSGFQRGARRAEDQASHAEQR